MANDRLNQIRDAERQSHEEIYSSAELFKGGSWLQKPVKTVLDIIPLLHNKSDIRVLDLGCGIGRNCIPIAKALNNECKIDCIDILDLAIEKLHENAEHHKVEKYINGIVSTIENFNIQRNTYDLILAVSAIEHICSEDAFVEKLIEIRDGLKTNGIVCLIVNSNVTEKDKNSGKYLQPQFEVNFSSEQLIKILHKLFNTLTILKETTVSQQYDIPRLENIVSLSTDVITFVAQNK